MNWCMVTKVPTTIVSFGKATLRDYFLALHNIKFIACTPPGSTPTPISGAEEKSLAEQIGISYDGTVEGLAKEVIKLESEIPLNFAECGDACSECEPGVCSCCENEYDKLNDLLACMRKKFSGLFILLNYLNTGKIDYETFSWTNWFK